MKIYESYEDGIRLQISKKGHKSTSVRFCDTNGEEIEQFLKGILPIVENHKTSITIRDPKGTRTISFYGLDPQETRSIIIKKLI